MIILISLHRKTNVTISLLLPLVGMCMSSTTKNYLSSETFRRHELSVTQT